MLRIYNGRILKEAGIERGELWCRDGRFMQPEGEPDRSIDAHGLLISPGYIDMQINGAYGIDFTSSPDRVGEAARKLPIHGVTAFCPTIVSTDQSAYRRIIHLLQPREIDGGASIIGIHLEGPFFDKPYCGAHATEKIRHYASFEGLNAFYGGLAGVRVVTLSPGQPKILEAIQILHQRHVVVSLGHGDACYSKIEEAIQAGACMVTHLFNGMPHFHHRRPGLIDAALLDPKMDYSLIADGVHVGDHAIRLAWSLNANGLVLVSDAIAAMGQSEKESVLGGQMVDVHQNIAYLKGTNVLAGSVTPLDACVRHLLSVTGCSLVEAIRAATIKPAQILGIASKKGSLQIGADADFLFLDDNLRVKETFIGGARVY